MDLEGKFLFEPMATSATYVCDISGIGVGSGADGSKIVIDREGTVLFTSENRTTDIYVNNGVVCEELKGAFSTDETFTFLFDE